MVAGKKQEGKNTGNKVHRKTFQDSVTTPVWLDRNRSCDPKWLGSGDVYSGYGWWPVRSPTSDNINTSVPSCSESWL